MLEHTPNVIGDESICPKGLISELADGFRQTAEEVVPWFLEKMPPMYFQDTDHATMLSHLRAIIAAKASNRPIELTLRNEDGSEWTSMRPQDDPGVLAEIVSQLPTDQPLRKAKIHTANDGQLVIDTFEFGDHAPFDPNDPTQAEKLRETIEYASVHLPQWSAEEATDYFHRCSADYIFTLTPLRMCNHWELFKQVTCTDGTAVGLERESDPTMSRIIVTVSNATRRTMLERIAYLLAHSKINTHRAYLDSIDDYGNGWISILGFVVTGPDGGPIDPESEFWKNLHRDILRLKWLDQHELDLAYRRDEVSLTSAEIIDSLCDLVHQVLVKVNPYAFNQDRIRNLAERDLSLTINIVQLFCDRFNPDGPLSDDDYAKQVAILHDEIDNEVDLEDARIILRKMIEAVTATLRTNLYLEDRYSLSFRLDPNFLTTPERPEVPFGVFFIHGRNFNGFHVRFRDIARGGIRAIVPVGTDQHAREAERLYDEAYGLAYAQQLKNKDIPEGGSKAAVLLEPNARVGRSIKAFVDGIIDLITPDPETRRFVVDRFGAEELIYLGPDENITPELIEWIVDRARRRGYPSPTALMSSKPGAGINHKEFGVTSEGVNVFLQIALQSRGIDPFTQPFTVKMTGGPDGDVAGNLIRIFGRDYGSNTKVVGIADGSGCGEDPDGLDHDELMRLVHEVAPIGAFDRSKLGPRGKITTLDEPDGVHLRNTLHNRIVADAFVPCGGRPNSIHDGNWRDFLTAEGKPSSPIIVEGANLFLTPDARTSLSEQGTMILKDSSANKCGVITSSFEIVACMLLSEEEFLSIKKTFVEQVLDRLRELARREAELLMRVYRHRPHVPLPTTSISLSRVMIRAADAIEEAVERLTKDDGEILRHLVIEHLPPILVETAGERLWTQTPQPYLKWIMAKSLAARIVYREGFDYLDSMPLEAIADLAVKYLQLELERRTLIDQVTTSSLPDKQRIAELLDKAGILNTLD
ncbi:MAG: NAD-glutamate dehydrogenase [Planctomycetota bacterium]|nr:NAD-glutamate dehydrogenase [Planctomycetota bacterium]